MEKFIQKIQQNIKVEFNFKIAMSFLIMFLVAFDLGTKFWADDVLRTQTITVVENFFNFALAYNTGVSFSMFNDLETGKYLLSTIAICAGIFLEVLVLASTKKIEIIGYTLIASGAYANGIDRLLNGHVIDFLDFYYKNWHYPTFNFADCFIFVGVAVLLLEGVITNKLNKTKTI